MRVSPLISPSVMKPILSFFITCAALILCLTLTTPGTRAQQQAPPPPPPPPARPTPPPPTLNKTTDGQEVDDGETLEFKTSLVNLQVRVIDRQNRPINDVRKEDFRVFEDGQPQSIEFFSTEEVPISYGIVVDNSGSLRQQLEKVIAAGRTIVESNKQGDETFLIRFTDSSRINLDQEWTSDKTVLQEKLDDLYPDSGQTAVYDAVNLAAEYATERRKGEDPTDRRRRALIIVTDGEERNSVTTEKELFARLRESDVQIFIIGFTGDLDEQDGGIIKKSSRSKATNLINKLATETGGRAFFPNSVNELPQIAEQITRDLRTQFIVSYNPTNKRRDGTFRRVRVALADDSRGKRIAVTRPGYTAPNEAAASSTTGQRPRALTTPPKNN